MPKQAAQCLSLKFSDLRLLSGQFGCERRRLNTGPSLVSLPASPRQGTAVTSSIEKTIQSHICCSLNMPRKILTPVLVPALACFWNLPQMPKWLAPHQIVLKCHRRKVLSCHTIQKASLTLHHCRFFKQGVFNVEMPMQHSTDHFNHF